MKSWKRIILAFLGLVIASVIFGSLIIYVTPKLYNIHPLSPDNSSPSVTPIPEVITDSLVLHGDTLIYYQRKTATQDIPVVQEPPTIGDLGTFGDSAGFWNAIFSALAMTFVAITLFYQFNKDSKEDERARIAQFQEQCLTMLSMLSEIVSQLRIPQRTSQSFGISTDIRFPEAWNPSSNQGIPTETTEKTEPVANTDVTGRASFKYIYDERPERRNIRDHIGYNFPNTSSTPTEDLYQSLRKITETHFDHYFRTVYRIFKFIKESDLGGIEKKKQEDIRDLCADLIRAQLSTYELAILYYNGLYPKYRNTSKPIYEHFCLFDNLDPQYLILNSEKDYYQQVQIHHKNPGNYDSIIHYNFTAFTKAQHANKQKNKAKWPKWLRRTKIRFLRGRNKNDNEKIREGNEFTSQELAVYNTLKSRAGETSTVKELVRLSKVNEKALKKAISRLESDGIIDIESKPHGKRYTILKDL